MLRSEDKQRQHLFRSRIAASPAGPGVYRWLDASGSVLYVGKAKNVRNRLRNYLQKNDKGPWKEALMKQAHDFDVTLTHTELEALVLETNLIKELRPKYNVLMKDGKNYVYVRISGDPYPTVDVVRKMDPSPPERSRVGEGGRAGGNKAKYFGPYLSAWETRRMLDLLHEFFPFRACRESLERLNKEENREKKANRAKGALLVSRALRPCLGHHIGQCIGLCVAAVSGEEYRSRIAQIARFFKGEYGPVKERIKILMREAAEERKFERAAHLRDDLKIVEGLEEEQWVSDPSMGDADFIGVALLSGRAHVCIFIQRGGKVIGEHCSALAGSAATTSDVLEQFLPQFYESVSDIPDTLLVPEEFSERGLFAEYLSLQKGRKVTIAIPERGKKSHLRELAEKNALAKAKQGEAKWEADARNTQEAMQQLQSLLKLPAAPERIECYDISHLGGTETVGSMVVFRNAKPARDHYRSFAIRTMKDGEVDDYKALREVLKRRMRYLKYDLKKEEQAWKKKGVTFARAKKSEQAIIEAVHAAHPSEMSAHMIDYRQYTVARVDGEIVGFGRLFRHPKNILELKSVWIADARRGNRLGQFIARKILHGVKKGKVYVIITPALEEYYAEIGFRSIREAPPALIQEMKEEKEKFPEISDGIAMAYEISRNKIDPSFTMEPSLIVVDGGKGQLSAALEVLRESGASIPVIGLAKREEDVFLSGKPDPVPFPRDAPAKFLLMRLRDEAHRFANSLRETRGAKRSVRSALDGIPGIGPQTKKELLERFGAVSGVKEAGDRELRKILSEEQIRELRARL